MGALERERTGCFGGLLLIVATILWFVLMLANDQAASPVTRRDPATGKQYLCWPSDIKEARRAYFLNREPKDWTCVAVDHEVKEP